MQVSILGSGGWEGVPSPFCNCVVCREATDNSRSKDSRTRPGFFVEGVNGNFLIELSPDLRIQSNKFHLPIINDFLISHWHFDHLYGILELHAWSKFIVEGKLNIFCSKVTQEWIGKNFGHINKNVIVVKPYESFLLHGVKVTPIPVYHMHAIDSINEDDQENTFGYMLEHLGRKIVYLADYYKLPSETIKIAEHADVIIADGTYLFEDLFPDKPSQNALKADPDHLHGKDIFDLLKLLNPKKVIFFSITHLTEKKHAELEQLLPKNYEISYDGMMI